MKAQYPEVDTKTVGTGKGRASNLEMIVQALQATGRLPCILPNNRYPAHFTLANIAELHVDPNGSGFAANIEFKNVPPGLPDCVGTPDAMIIPTAELAFLMGAAIVCEIATGSRELPFVFDGTELIAAVYN